MEVRYLYHSGYLVDTGAHVLIFDYYLNSPQGAGLKKGVVNPEELEGRNVVVFSSHHHQDHFNPCIFGWRKKLPDARYVISDDITTFQRACMVYPGQSLDLGDLQVHTLKSTDEGVAFLVHVDGLCIYHAGDLNWWHWEGSSDQENQEMGERFREQINLLKGESVDAAFLPVDPRLEDAYLLGLDYVMQTIDVKRVYPMHFWDDCAVTARLQEDPAAAPFKERVAVVTQRGQVFDGL